MKGKKGSGRGKGLGVVTMATAFTVSAEPEIEFVRSVARRCGCNESCDDLNPFDVYSPSEELCSEKTFLSDWHNWRRHLIEIHPSVLQGIILKPLRKSHQFSKLDADEFEFVDCDDERPALNDRLVPIPDGKLNQIIKNIKDVKQCMMSLLSLHISNIYAKKKRHRQEAHPDSSCHYDFSRS